MNPASTSRASFITLALLLAGCATIVSGTKQDVRINSSPSTAHVKVERSDAGQMETVWEGTTPAVASLARKHTYVLTLSLDGYRPVEMGLAHGTNGWIWGNIVFGGLIGLVVDFSNGAAKTLKPDEIDVEMISVTATGPQGEQETLYAVFRVMDTSGHLRVTPVAMERRVDPTSVLN